MKAIWNNEVIAESDQTVQIEGNHYFPEDSIKKEFFEDSGTKTHCDWNGSTKLTTRGEASYFSLNVDGQNNKDAAWYYPDLKSMAAGIKEHVAFWKGVKVEK
jgi:uncharacterized protein (DUF427 family)